MSRGFMGVSWGVSGFGDDLWARGGFGWRGSVCIFFAVTATLAKIREETRAVRFHGGFMGVSWGVSGFGDDLLSRGGFAGWGRGVSGSVFLMVPNI